MLIVVGLKFKIYPVPSKHIKVLSAKILSDKKIFYTVISRVTILYFRSSYGSPREQENSQNNWDKLLRTSGSEYSDTRRKLSKEKARSHWDILCKDQDDILNDENVGNTPRPRYAQE